MKIGKVKNENYAAVVVKITTLLPLEGCDFVQAAIIMGNQVIVGKDLIDHRPDQTERAKNQRRNRNRLLLGGREPEQNTYRFAQRKDDQAKRCHHRDSNLNCQSHNALDT